MKSISTRRNTITFGLLIRRSRVRSLSRPTRKTKT